MVTSARITRMQQNIENYSKGRENYGVNIVITEIKSLEREI